MIEKIGVIQSASFGIGGYQDCQVTFSFHFKGEGWGTIHTFECGWAHVSEADLKKPGAAYKWTHEDRIKQMGESLWKVIGILKDAKVNEFYSLVGKPVAVTFESEVGRNIGFRILKEAVL